MFEGTFSLDTAQIEINCALSFSARKYMLSSVVRILPLYKYYRVIKGDSKNVHTEQMIID